APRGSSPCCAVRSRDRSGAAFCARSPPPLSGGCQRPGGRHVRPLPLRIGGHSHHIVPHRARLPHRGARPLKACCRCALFDRPAASWTCRAGSLSYEMDHGKGACYCCLCSWVSRNETDVPSKGRSPLQEHRVSWPTRPLATVVLI